MDFCKNPTFTCIFLDFLEKSIFFLEFFWIFDIRIGKINLFPRFFLDFCKNPSFPLGFLPFFEKSIFSLGFFTFFEKSIFFLEFFWIFDLETQKSKHPFEESKKIQKTLGNPKIYLFDLNPKILFEKMDFWIFGWTILRNPRLHLLDLNPSILVERWIVVFLFPFFGRISAL